MTGVRADPSALPEHGVDLVGGFITVDDTSFATHIALHSGVFATSLYACVSLFDSVSPQSFLLRSAYENMKAARVASTTCEHVAPPRSWDGFGSSKLP